MNLHLGQKHMSKGGCLFLMGDCTLDSPFFYVMGTISIGASVGLLLC
jgi:hypothetical protein